MQTIRTDAGLGRDNIGVASQLNLTDHSNKWSGKFFIDKWEFPEEIRTEAELMLKGGATIEQVKARFGDKYYLGKTFAGENLLLNEGINALWTLVGGGAETLYNNANARLGVGASATAAAATDTGLLTTPTFVAMDASYPTYGTVQKITFRSTFTSAVANIAWNEFSADNGNTANKNLNRLVSAQGTKTSGQTWQLTLDVTLS